MWRSTGTIDRRFRATVTSAIDSRPGGGWAFDVRDLEAGAGDVCPSAVDPTDPFADPSALARFPEPAG